MSQTADLTDQAADLLMSEAAPQAIQYRPERPTFDALIEMSRLVEEQDYSEYFNSWVEKLFFTKSHVWEYEQEWRMIKFLQDAAKVI